MKKATWLLLLGLTCLNAQAGVINPDCTAEKAAKSSVRKAVGGIGGRCSAKEAAADTVLGNRGPLSNAKDRVSDRADRSAGPGRKAVKKVVDH